jgi:hypothetical protein
MAIKGIKKYLVLDKLVIARYTPINTIIAML